jgi:hypothetical protein
MKKQIAIATFGLLTTCASLAVPLFGETAGTIRDGILTLYKDSEDSKKVYFFPNSTKFSVDNSKTPLFNFVYWGLDHPTPGGDVGAYMSLSTHLAADASMQAALDHYMKDHPEMEVAVLPIKSSMIGLETTAAGKQPLSILFSEFNFARHGGRAEDEIGVNAVLTPIGARAFKALLKKEMAGSPLKFDYCYTIQGFGPNMNASVSVDMRRVYDYFEASHTGGWGWFAWSIKAVVEKLNDQRAIKITMNGGDAKEWEVLNKVAEQITKRLFVPELQAQPVTPASTNNLFNFGVGGVHKEELKTETWTLVRRDLEDREFCTDVVIKDLDGFQDKLITSAD